MNNTKTVLLVVIVALIVSFVGAKFFSGSANKSNQDLLAKVLNSGEIRVGYAVNPPELLLKDPNTGTLSGICYDVMEQVGKNLNLKINWVEEVGFGTMIEGLNAGKYDIIPCIWPNAARGKNADFTIPLYYSAEGVYTRVGDNRFSDLSRINSQDITIATLDGEMSSFIAKMRFPKAKILTRRFARKSNGSAFNRVNFWVNGKNWGMKFTFHPLFS